MQLMHWIGWLIIFHLISSKGATFCGSPSAIHLVSSIFDLKSFSQFEITILSEFDEVETLIKWGQTLAPLSAQWLNGSGPWEDHVTMCAAGTTIFARVSQPLKFLYQIKSIYGNATSSELQQSRSAEPYVFILVDADNGTTQDFKSDSAPENPLGNLFSIGTNVFLVYFRYAGSEVIVSSILELYSLKAHDLSKEIHPRKYQGKKIHFGNILPKASRRANFERVEIIGIDVDEPSFPFSVKYKLFPNDTSNRTEFESGFSVDEFRYLKDALNFTEGAEKWPNYIRQKPDGSITGLADPVNNGTADICISLTELLEYRMTAPNGITFLHPNFHNEPQMFFKQPAASSIRDIYAIAFTFQVWAAVLTSWLLIGGALLLLTAFRVFLGLRLDLADARICEEVWIWVVGTACLKSWHLTPSSSPSRTVCLIGLATSVLIFAAYSASLTSILSVEVIPVQQFPDLLDHGFEIYSDNHIPSATFMIKYLQNEGTVSLPPGSSDGTMDVAKEVHRVIRNKAAVLSITDSFLQIAKDRFDDRYVCSTFSTVRFSRRPILDAMFVKRGSPLQEYFNYKIISMKERGVMFRLRSHFIEDTSVRCFVTDSDFDQQLHLKDVITAFGILTLGLMLGPALLLGEKLIWLGKRGRPSLRSKRPPVEQKLNKFLGSPPHYF